MTKYGSNLPEVRKNWARAYTSHNSMPLAEISAHCNQPETVRCFAWVQNASRGCSLAKVLLLLYNKIHYINIFLACFHVNDVTSAGASHRFGVISSDAALSFCNQLGWNLELTSMSQKLFANLGQTVLEPPFFGDRLVPSGDLSNHITVQSCSLQLLEYR